MIKRLLLSCVLLVILASTVEAQIFSMQSWDGRGYAHLNFGGQSGEETFTDSSTFTIYGEQGAVAAGHTVGGGTLFDIGAGWRVWRSLAVGLAYSSVSNKNDAIVTARVPHPLIFRQLRDVSAAAEDLVHSEKVVHLQFVWIMPLTSKIQVAFMGGPSFFSVRQESATVNPLQDISDPAPFNNLTLRGISVTELKDSPVGGHVEIDGTYLVTTYRGFRIGVGGFVRYSGASVDLPTLEGVTRDGDLSVGGGQAGGGLRIGF